MKEKTFFWRRKNKNVKSFSAKWWNVLEKDVDSKDDYFILRRQPEFIVTATYIINILLIKKRFTFLVLNDSYHCVTL